MPQSDHTEKHFMAPDLIRDIVIGMADGLTVPFALAAGLSGTVANSTLVVVAGLAEIAAGSIAMGLGGFLAARTDREHYLAELARERREIVELPEHERQEVMEILMEWGLGEKEAALVTGSIIENPEKWVEFMMKFELGLEEPEPSRARNSSLTIGISYIVGGFVPLFPYMIIHHPTTALITSVIFTLIALFIFGFVKGQFTGGNRWKSAWQTTLVGGIAAAVAFVVARWIS